MQRSAIFTLGFLAVAACTSFGAEGTAPPDAGEPDAGRREDASADAPPDAPPGPPGPGVPPGAEDAGRERDAGSGVRPRIAFVAGPMLEPADRDSADRACQTAGLPLTGRTFWAYLGARSGEGDTAPEARFLIPSTTVWTWPKTSVVAFESTQPKVAGVPPFDATGVRVDGAVAVWVAWSAASPTYLAASIATLPSLGRAGANPGGQAYLLCLESVTP